MYSSQSDGGVPKSKDEEFPILCETCLGENPFVRMTKQPYAKACKICDRPFTVYRWRPGPRARFKKTELCHTCAKLKNVCQTCVLDLEYGLPVQVRDTALEEWEKQSMPSSDLNREYMIENLERKGVMEVSDYGKQHTPPSALLSALARKTPYYRRNLPHVCSFFAKGACNRGALCPYRHEMPETGELANQNIKDRYNGSNDPVANKMLRRSKAATAPLPVPADTSIMTLWVGGVDDDPRSEMELREQFQPFGEILSLRVVPQKSCAFITYATRASAEAAAARLYDKLNLRGKSLRMAWGRRQGSEAASSVPPPPGMAPLQSVVHENPNAALGTDADIPAPGMAAPPPPGMGPARPYYPSQDPRNMSAKLPM